MKPGAKKFLMSFIDQLNVAITEDPDLVKVMDAEVDKRKVLDVFNQCLEKATGGGRILAARETDGSLVGFVSNPCAALASNGGDGKVDGTGAKVVP